MEYRKLYADGLPLYNAMIRVCIDIIGYDVFDALTPHEYVFIKIADIPINDCGFNDFIDGVMLFGDYTLEFHYKNGKDAYNWKEFDYETNISVWNAILEVN